jgi:molybdopterin converting factor small subunit
VQVKLKLFASLRQYLPQAKDGELAVALEEGSAVDVLLTLHGLPREQVHLVLVNGHYIAPDELGEHALKDGDEVALWPPVAGG